MTDVIHDDNIQCNLLKIFKNIFFKHSNLRKVNSVAYFVVLRREPMKWAQCIQGLSELAEQNNMVKSSSSGDNRKNI
jgi:hypothetical protein